MSVMEIEICQKVALEDIELLRFGFVLDFIIFCGDSVESRLA